LLLATLRYRLGPRLECAGIALRWEVQEVPVMDWIDPRNALHILRILQEAFANIVKHAHATEIRVATRVDGGTVLVVVADNGSGFPLEEGLRKNGKGLGNQRRRAAAIGADVVVVSDGSGTCLTLRLPVAKV
jgi:signal transduction histidine kinase